MADELKGKRILLVDDDPDVIQSIRMALSETGVEVDDAADGNAALEKIARVNPDLIVLDMMLPKRSGFLVLERLRKGKPKTAPPPVIMITGNPGTRHRVYAETLGVAMYLNKPFRMDRLVEKVKELLS